MMCILCLLMIFLEKKKLHFTDKFFPVNFVILIEHFILKSMFKNLKILKLV